MTDPSDFILESYDYYLDPSLIAQDPAKPRHSARLLIVQDLDNLNQCSRHSTVWEWQNELRAGDLIVVNNTRVVKARLSVRREGGGLGELFLLEPLSAGQWLCLARPAKRMRKGDYLWIEAFRKKPLRVEVIDSDENIGGRIIQFPEDFFDRESIFPFLEAYGQVPLPPYIKGADFANQDRYQTCFAQHPGAVAAPTAGLHLSNDLLKSLENKGIKKAEITLHVGLGTFKPLDQQDLSRLELHNEWVEVSLDTVNAINECNKNGGRVIAVGTTTVRALEASFDLKEGKLKAFKGNVDLVIKPGHKFKVVEGLLTNFHLPKSSLLLLVSALIGRKKLLAIYKEASELKYRFYSFGDAMWIPPEVIMEDKN